MIAAGPGHTNDVTARVLVDDASGREPSASTGQARRKSGFVVRTNGQANRSS